MTRRTIPVERTVQEDVLLCDFCGESEDDKPDGEMVTYSPAFGDYPDMHLHEDCAERGLGDIGPRPEKDGVVWRAIQRPVELVAEQSAAQDGRVEPNKEDEFIGWMVLFFFLFFFVLFFFGVL